MTPPCPWPLRPTSSTSWPVSTVAICSCWKPGRWHWAGKPASTGLGAGRFDHVRPANSAARRATGVAFQLENGVIRCLDVETLAVPQKAQVEDLCCFAFTPRGLAVVCGPGCCSHCPSTPR